MGTYVIHVIWMDGTEGKFTVCQHGNGEGFLSLWEFNQMTGKPRVYKLIPHHNVKSIGIGR